MEMKHGSHATAVSQQLNSRDLWVVTVNVFHRTGDLKLLRDPLNLSRLAQYNESSWGARVFSPEGASPTNRCIIWQGNVKEDFPDAQHPTASTLLLSCKPMEEKETLCIWTLADVYRWTVERVHVHSRLFLSFLPIIVFLHYCCHSLAPLLFAHVSVHAQSTRTRLLPNQPSPALHTVNF